MNMRITIWAWVLISWTIPAAAQEWQSLGPSPIDRNNPYLRTPDGGTGRAAAIAASATRANRYYAGGASGGVWESVDGGENWTPLTDQLPALAIGAVALDPEDDRIIYAGSGEANNAYHSLYGFGLYKSTDRGKTWQVLARQTFAGRAFSRLAVSPFDRQVVWAALSRAGGTWEGNEGARQHPARAGAMGLFRSRDGGDSWQHLRAAQGLPAIPAADVDLDPQDRQRIYASLADPFGAAGNGIYRSTDGGESFERLDLETPAESIGRIALAIAPSDPQRLYALVTNASSRESRGGFMPSGDTTLGVFRSDDGGDSWTFFNPGSFQSQQGVYNCAIAVHPTDRNIFFLGGVQMLRSTNGGETYVDVTPLHVDIHDITFDAAGRLLAASDGGIHRSDDLGDTWVNRNGGLGLIQFYPGLSLDPTDPWIIVGGTQDNGTHIRSNGARFHYENEPGEWFVVFGGDGGYTAIKPDQPEVIFVEYQGTGTLYRSDVGGLYFGRSSAGIDLDDRNCFMPPVTFDPADTNRLLYATHRIYESTNVGDSWTAISDDLTGGPPAAVRALVIAPSNSNVVYAATNDDRVLVSNDAGHTWDLSLEDVAAWPRVTRQLAVDPLRPSLAYVAVSRFNGERLLMTKDRGRNWSAIGEGLPNFPVNTVAVYRTEKRRFVLVGTDAGVYFSGNNGGEWRKYGKNLPRAPVMDLVVDAQHQRLVASTLGRGMWSVALPEG
ncbi:MAG: hypothetical protein GY856_13100 [bacterium]|nr:hypothetical protein [bacterium]